MNKRQFIFALAAVGVLTMWQRVHASRPVPFEVVGCVRGGVFSSEDHIFPVQAQAGKADLAAYEGKTVEITGYLNPGDRLGIDKVRIVPLTVKDSSTEASSCAIPALRNKERSKWRDAVSISMIDIVTIQN